MTEFNITNNTAGVLVLTSLDNFNLGIGQTKDMFAPANGNFAVGDMVQNEELQVLLDATSIGITDEVPNTITNLDVIGNLLTGGGTGDMTKAVYDSTNINADAFDKANEIGVKQVTGGEINHTMTGNVNNFNMGTANYLFVDTSSDRDWTGFVAPPSGVERIIQGVNKSDKKIKFQNNDSSSSSANRLLLKEYANKDCKKGEPFAFKYDHNDNRWRPYIKIG